MQQSTSLEGWTNLSIRNKINVSPICPPSQQSIANIKKEAVFLTKQKNNNSIELRPMTISMTKIGSADGFGKVVMAAALSFLLLTTVKASSDLATVASSSRKLSSKKTKKTKKNGGPPHTNMCSLVQTDLYFNVTVVNEYGSENIFQIFSGPEPIASEKICEPDDQQGGYKYCIGDVVNTKTSLYSDKSLTNKVAFVTSTSATTGINESGAAVFTTTGTLRSLVETGNELVYLGNFEIAEYGPVNDVVAEDLAVVGGTGDCDYFVGTINFDVVQDDEVGSVGIVNTVVKIA